MAAQPFKKACVFCTVGYVQIMHNVMCSLLSFITQMILRSGRKEGIGYLTMLEADVIKTQQGAQNRSVKL